MQNKQKEVKQGRKFTQLTLEERIRIEIRYRDGCSLRQIAEELGNGRTAGSISREIAGKPRRGIGKYQARISHEKALCRRTGKKGNRLKNTLIRTYTKEKLKLGWSPEQITLRLSRDHPGESISYEAIYQYIYSQIHRQGNGLVKKGCEDLRSFLARRHKRRQKKGFRKAQRVQRESNLPSIENRPKYVERRKEIGHWEDDCVVSREGNACLKSINERASGIIFIVKMKEKSMKETNRVLKERLSPLPRHLRKTLTRDRGTENFGYREIESSLELSCYFAHAYCSWEKGSNENGNGLIRRFLPKKTNFSEVSQERIKEIEYLLNSRPRKRFGGKTPYEVFFEQTGVALDC